MEGSNESVHEGNSFGWRRLPSRPCCKVEDVFIAAAAAAPLVEFTVPAKGMKAIQQASVLTFSAKPASESAGKTC